MSTTQPSRPNGSARAVVLKTLKGAKTLAQLSSDFGIHAQQITERSGVPVEAAVTRRNPQHIRVSDQQTAPQYRTAGANQKPCFSADWLVEAGRPFRFVMW